MLGPEERMLLQWIQQYEVLSFEQAIRLLFHKPRSVALKIIRGLQKEHLISYVSRGNYIGAYPCSVPEPRRIDAIWVLLQFVEKIDHYEHHCADFPSQIFFLKEGMGYEIVVLRDGETHLSRLLQSGEDLKYIIVVPNEQMIPLLQLPDAPCLFAVIQWTGGPAPEISFYSKER